MLVVTSSKVNVKRRVYHRFGCIYASRIKSDNRVEVSENQAKKSHYHECKYCAGFREDVNVYNTTFVRWSRKKNFQFIYHKKTDALYVQTEIGFWKICLNENGGMYLLFHRNTYSTGMKFNEAVNGGFHRQRDVQAMKSIEKLVNYIVAHDRAKLTIADDYRKLPKRTNRQKKYYQLAERKDARKKMRRLDSIFAAIEKAQPEIKQYAFC